MTALSASSSYYFNQLLPEIASKVVIGPAALNSTLAEMMDTCCGLTFFCPPTQPSVLPAEPLISLPLLP